MPDLPAALLDFLHGGRLLYLDFPACPGLELRGFDGVEALSRPGWFELELHGGGDVDPSALLGRPVTFGVRLALGSGVRLFRGLVARFRQVGPQSYRARVVPWLGLLDLSADCRLFAGLSAPAVVELLHDEFLRATGRDDRLEVLVEADRHPAREYTVQYRESALAFLHGLLGAAGLFYFFEGPEPGEAEPGPRLVLADSGAACRPCVGLAGALPHRPAGRGAAGPEDLIRHWRPAHRLRPGAFALADYDYRDATGPIVAEAPSRRAAEGVGPREQFDYPGGFRSFEAGAAAAERLRQQSDLAGLVIDGRGTARPFRAGGRFRLAEPPGPGQPLDYLLTSVRHRAREGGRAAEPSYRNRFRCVPCPEDDPPRSLARPARRARIGGPQTATVVALEGSDVPLPHLGRLAVRFHWSRRDEPSCWVRVAQDLAGRGWGTTWWPSVGQEVIVQFLDGDPERPLVTGCAYNAANPPPVDPVEHPTRWGFRGPSTDERSNELRLEEGPAGGRALLQAGRDLTLRAGDDAREAIGRDHDRAVGRDGRESVGHDRDTTIGRDDRARVGRDRHLTVEGKEAVAVAGGQSLTIGGDAILVIGGRKAERVDGELHVRAATIVLEATGALTISTPGTLTIEGGLVLINSGGAPRGQGGTPSRPAAPRLPEVPPADVPAAPASVPAERPEPYRPPAVAEADAATTWAEIELVDDHGDPVPGEEYRILLSDGRVIEGTLDGRGAARVEGIDRRLDARITFPGLDREAWGPA